jgi:hypothetical protein
MKSTLALSRICIHYLSLLLAAFRKCSFKGQTLSIMSFKIDYQKINQIYVYNVYNSVESNILIIYLKFELKHLFNIVRFLRLC